MLNKANVLKQLTIALETDFSIPAGQLDSLLGFWHTLSRSPELLEALSSYKHLYPIPQWQGSLDSSLAITPQKSLYRVIGVDGSQIYPDRHHTIASFLINIGTVLIHYKNFRSRVALESIPSVVMGVEAEDWSGAHVEIINCRRTELELRTGLELSEKSQEQEFLEEQVCFFDGSLIFWHLEHKDPEIKYRFMTSYLASLQQLYERKLLHIGYISSPKSKDLIALLRCAHHIRPSSSLHESLVDADLVALYVPQHSRTILFKSSSLITQQYPDHLKPYFFYLNTGYEIARIEIPAWMVQQEQIITLVCSIVLDQALKGTGYPVCLSEAHEQAVIKGADREFFYHALHRLNAQSTTRYSFSQKLLKKRGAGV
jgi:hypothetical protein